jgi:hypothetical protein
MNVIYFFNLRSGHIKPRLIIPPIFLLYQLVHVVDSIHPIECEIPSLKLVVELLPNTSNLEEHLMHLEHLDE